MTNAEPPWVEPTFRCGKCGGDIARWPMLNLLRQEILDWRHKSVPEGVAPHRAVLGTPAHRPRISQVDDPDEIGVDITLVVEPDPAPRPAIPARPATHDQLPTSARSLDKLAAARGWEVEATYMQGPWMDARWKFSRLIESIVLRFRRDGHGLVAIWDTPAWMFEWKFDTAYSLTHTTEAIGSPELRRLLAEPRMICERCGETSALHLWTGTTAVCFNDTSAEQKEA